MLISIIKTIATQVCAPHYCNEVGSGVNVGCRLGMDRNLLLDILRLAGQYCLKISKGGSQRVEDAVNGKICTFGCYSSYDG